MPATVPTTVPTTGGESRYFAVGKGDYARCRNIRYAGAQVYFFMRLSDESILTEFINHSYLPLGVPLNRRHQNVAFPVRPGKVGKLIADFKLHPPHFTIFDFEINLLLAHDLRDESHRGDAAASKAAQLRAPRKDVSAWLASERNRAELDRIFEEEVAAPIRRASGVHFAKQTLDGMPFYDLFSVRPKGSFNYVLRYTLHGAEMFRAMRERLYERVVRAVFASDAYEIERVAHAADTHEKVDAASTHDYNFKSYDVWISGRAAPVRLHHAFGSKDFGHGEGSFAEQHLSMFGRMNLGIANLRRFGGRTTREWDGAVRRLRDPSARARSLAFLRAYLRHYKADDPDGVASTIDLGWLESDAAYGKHIRNNPIQDAESRLATLGETRYRARALMHYQPYLDRMRMPDRIGVGSFVFELKVRYLEGEGVCASRSHTNHMGRRLGRARTRKRRRRTRAPTRQRRRRTRRRARTLR